MLYSNQLEETNSSEMDLASLSPHLPDPSFFNRSPFGNRRSLSRRLQTGEHYSVRTVRRAAAHLLFIRLCFIL